jgi:predicted metal-dependent TIM-barrel fold hydrolase
MRIFDPHIHMTSRTTDDYEAMAAAGIEAIIEPAFWLGQPRTSLGSFVDYFDALIGWERFRASQFGIRHHCTMGLNPKEANDEPLARQVLEVLPRYLAKDRVVAVGEIGFDGMTVAEERAFTAQLELAIEHDLPVLVHTPHRDKPTGTTRSLELVAGSGIPAEHVLIDHNNELTYDEVLASGCWCGFTIYPDTKMDEHRLVRIVEQHGIERVIINSAADWGRSDPLKVPKTVAALQAAGFAEGEIQRLVWDNPVAFFGQSGRLELEPGAAAPDPSATFAGNSILRGARAQ